MSWCCCWWWCRCCAGCSSLLLWLLLWLSFVAKVHIATTATEHNAIMMIYLAIVVLASLCTLLKMSFNISIFIFRTTAIFLWRLDELLDLRIKTDCESKRRSTEADHDHDFAFSSGIFTAPGLFYLTKQKMDRSSVVSTVQTSGIKSQTRRR